MSERGAVELVSVSKRYGTTLAVDRINLKIPANSYCCLLGPSGCGKTSTLRMIAGHERISDGDIRIGNDIVNQLPPAQRPTAMMFQNYALFPHLNCVDNVAFSLKMRGVNKHERREKAMELLHLVHMEDYAGRLPSQLSGGQQQRVALSRALITNPSVLLLDEPLSALDPFLRIRMREELRRLQRELGLTFIHVTHSQEEAMALSDLIVVMDEGHIEQSGTPREVYNEPKTRFVARFIGGHNIIEAEVKSRAGEYARLNDLGAGSFTVEQASIGSIGSIGNAGKVTFAVRTDKIRLLRSDNDQARAADNRLPGIVRAIEYRGAWVQLGLEAPAVDEFSVMLHESDFFNDPVDNGDRIIATWAVTDAHVLNSHA